MKFKKKPIVIEAVQITDSTFDYDHPNPEHMPGVIYDPVNRVVKIPTLEGEMTGQIGDWIIKGVKGELYPCKPEIFAATYDQVEQKVFGNWEDRDLDVANICKFFTYAHLQPKQQSIVEPIAALIDIILAEVRDTEETKAGLRKLLEAKDCFVRASLR